MSPKITFIGGGSYQWGPKLLLDIANTPSLQHAEIVLQDIDPTPLPKMLAFLEHVVATRKIGWRCSATTDQRAALANADYVIVCISTGGLESMAYDIDIPARYGIKQSVGDSVGPGGVNRGLRNIPILVNIARDMQELCPHAWLLNLTNPMTTLTRSVLSTTEIEAIGLCHEVTMAQFHLSMLLDCDMRSMELTVCGVNHLPLITALDITQPDGDVIDGLSLLADKLDEPDTFGEEILHLPQMMGGHETSTSGGAFTKHALLNEHRVKFELFRRFGALPAAGDRHLVEFFPGFLTEQSDWGARWGVQLTSMDDRRAWQDHYIGELNKFMAMSEIPVEHSGEMVASLIDARRRDRPRSYPLNIGNVGQCPDLGDDVVVESMCTVDGDGVHPDTQAYAPTLLGEYLRRVSASQELVVEAALSGERQLAFEAMLADPLASRIDYDDVWAMTNDLIDATAQWLPQFS